MALSIIASTNDEHTLSEASSMSSQSPSCIVPNTTYIGLASLLPSELRALCSCAGLFFAQRVGICANGDLYRVEVAALSQYLLADHKTRKLRVRTIYLTPDQAAQLLAYDRHLASLPTCDVCELLAEHTAQTATAISVAPSKPTETEASSAPVLREQEEADLVPLPALFVPRAIIRESLRVLQVTSKRDRRVQTALLHAALETISQLVDQCSSMQERRALEQRAEQIKGVRAWRRQRHDSGSGWQRVVALEPAWDQGKAGWDVIVGVPVRLAA